MRIQQDMRHRQTHHIGGEKQITRFSHENFLLWLYAFFATLKIGNIQLGGNSVGEGQIPLGGGPDPMLLAEEQELSTPPHQAFEDPTTTGSSARMDPSTQICGHLVRAGAQRRLTTNTKVTLTPNTEKSIVFFFFKTRIFLSSKTF